MTNKDKREFEQYLQQCTNSQVYGVLEKEVAAKRKAYANLARRELDRRGLPVQ